MMKKKITKVLFLLIPLILIFLISCSDKQTKNVTEQDKQLSQKIASKEYNSTPNPGDNWYFADVMSLSDDTYHTTLIEIKLDKVVNVYCTLAEYDVQNTYDFISSNIDNIYYEVSNDVDQNVIDQFYLYDIFYLYDYEANKELNEQTKFLYCAKIVDIKPGKYIIGRDVSKTNDYYDDLEYYDFVYILYNSLDYYDGYVLLFDDRNSMTYTYSKSFYEQYSSIIYEKYLTKEYYFEDNNQKRYKVNFESLLRDINS